VLSAGSLQAQNLPGVLSATEDACVSWPVEALAAANIADVSLDMGGRWYILWRDPPQIVVVGAVEAESHLVALERGNQPLPLVGPATLTIALDSLWVHEPMVNRVRVTALDRRSYDRADTIAPAWRDSVGTSNALAGILSDGQFYGTPVLLSPTTARGLVARAPVLRFDRAGVVFDTVAWLTVGDHHTLAMDIGATGYTGYVTEPFTELPLFEPSPRGEFFVLDTVAQLTVVVAPVELTERYLDRFVERRSSMPLFGGRVDHMAYRRAIWKPRFLPPVDELVVGADGSTWLRLPSDDPLLSPLREWVVIVSDFDKYYRVLLPATFTLKHATIDGLWGVDVGGASAAVCRYLIGPM
jgi:hypothetical protein